MDHPPYKPHCHLEPTTTTQARVSREHVQPPHARPSAQRPRRAGEDNLRHVNLDAHQHSVCNEPLREASSGELHQSDRVGLVKTPCGTSTSTRTLARSAASPLEQRAAPRLHTSGSTVTGECNLWHANLDELQHPDCRMPLQPARHARTSAQRPVRVGRYNVRHVNLDKHRRSAGPKPLRPPRRTHAIVDRARRDGDFSLRHVNLDAHRRSDSSEPLLPPRCFRASAR